MNKITEEPLLSLPERHNRILTLLQQNGSISVTQLSELFRVSEVTIRKDLSYLEQQKKQNRKLDDIKDNTKSSAMVYDK